MNAIGRLLPSPQFADGLDPAEGDPLARIDQLSQGAFDGEAGLGHDDDPAFPARAVTEQDGFEAGFEAGFDAGFPGTVSVTASQRALWASSAQWGDGVEAVGPAGALMGADGPDGLDFGLTGLAQWTLLPARGLDGVFAWDDRAQDLAAAAYAPTAPEGLDDGLQLGAWPVLTAAAGGADGLMANDLITAPFDGFDETAADDGVAVFVDGLAFSAGDGVAFPA
jgi:hypothetical protein